MGKVTIIELSELESIYGGDGYGSIFHPDTWLKHIEYALTHPGRGGTLPLCENYTPAYPGKILPQC